MNKALLGAFKPDPMQKVSDWLGPLQGKPLPSLALSGPWVDLCPSSLTPTAVSSWQQRLWPTEGPSCSHQHHPALLQFLYPKGREQHYSRLKTEPNLGAIELSSKAGKRRFLENRAQMASGLDSPCQSPGLREQRQHKVGLFARGGSWLQGKSFLNDGRRPSAFTLMDKKTTPCHYRLLEYGGHMA